MKKTKYIFRNEKKNPATFPWHIQRLSLSIPKQTRLRPRRPKKLHTFDSNPAVVDSSSEPAEDADGADDDDDDDDDDETEADDASEDEPDPAGDPDDVDPEAESSSSDEESDTSTDDAVLDDEEEALTFDSDDDPSTSSKSKLELLPASRAAIRETFSFLSNFPGFFRVDMVSSRCPRYSSLELGRNQVPNR
jgi:hypothetical protein